MRELRKSLLKVMWLISGIIGIHLPPLLLEGLWWNVKIFAYDFSILPIVPFHILHKAFYYIKKSFKIVLLLISK